jgi:hypothetical protein
MTFGTDIGVDPAAIEDFKAVLLDRHGVTLLQWRGDRSVRSVGGVSETVAGMDYVVTCRFHGVVLATC